MSNLKSRHEYSTTVIVLHHAVAFKRLAAGGLEIFGQFGSQFHSLLELDQRRIVRHDMSLPNLWKL